MCAKRKSSVPPFSIFHITPGSLLFSAGQISPISSSLVTSKTVLGWRWVGRWGVGGELGDGG